MLSQTLSTLTKANMNSRPDHSPWSITYEQYAGQWAWTLRIDDMVSCHADFWDVIDDFNAHVGERSWLRLPYNALSPIVDMLTPLQGRYTRMYFMPLEDAAYGLLFMGSDINTGEIKTMLYLDQDTCSSWESVRNTLTEHVIRRG